MSDLTLAQVVQRFVSDLEHLFYNARISECHRKRGGLAAKDHMEKTIGVLADYVSMSTEGKLHVLGVFSKIVAPQVPALHPSMTIVLQVLYGLSEVGSTTFEVDLVHDHGELLRKETVELELPPPTGGTLGTLNLLHRFVGTVVEWYGLYEFRLSLGKENIATIPFEVVEAPDRA